MIANTAFGILVLAELALVFASAVIVFGSRQDRRWLDSSRRAVQAAWFLVTLALGIFLYLLLENRVEFAAVYRVTRATLPFTAKLSALWGGQTGSLLFWTWLLGGAACVSATVGWKDLPQHKPWIVLFSAVPFAGFLFLVLFLENPFARWWLLPNGASTAQFLPPPGSSIILWPPDGVGLNPLLRHPAMVIHPPMLYLGFVIFVLPYALAMAALITGDWPRSLFEAIRISSLIAWFFLTLGLLLGSRWAYDVLGWGGYWGWDPVEIAGLLPWLSGSAALHLLIPRRRSASRQTWILAVILLTFSLVLLGSLLTRSGIVVSVHAFSESTLGTALMIIFLSISLASLALWGLRGRFPLDEPPDSESRLWTTLLHSSAVLFIFLVCVCLVGLFVPIVGEWFGGKPMMVGEAYYRQATGPLWIALLILTAIAPLWPMRLSTWQQMFRKMIPAVLGGGIAAGLSAWFFSLRLPEAALPFLAGFYLVLTLQVGVGAVGTGLGRGAGIRQCVDFLLSRRAAAAILHAGVFIFAFGVLGIEQYQHTTQGLLAPGGRMAAGEYSVRLNEIVQQPTSDERIVTVASLSLFSENPAGTTLLDEVFPRMDHDLTYQQTTAIPGVYSRLSGDLYILLTGVNLGETPSASIRVILNPLADFLWIGGLIMAAGALLLLTPHVFLSSSSSMSAPVSKVNTWAANGAGPTGGPPG
ncbi:MAG: cytochrome c biogenesis protein CcsA [Anaerolineales bacterium]|nr:cytochrome c biogenesis protein CcsA [Anaerolineales bacterium]